MEIKLLKDLPIKMFYKDIDKVSDAEFTQIRRGGFGGSDASVLVGVNPFSGHKELIASKVATEVTPEEAAIGKLRNVRAGRDLEPLIIKKIAQVFSDWHLFKPSNMYQFKEYPFLTMNFDAVGCGDVGLGYFPVEIKFVSTRGSFAYDLTKAIFLESKGFQDSPIIVESAQMPITAKAARSGIPAYYYTQVIQEEAALAAPVGYLGALFEKDWEFAIFEIPWDQSTFNQIVIAGSQLWPQIEQQKKFNAAKSTSEQYVDAENVEGQY